jgi:hypothetical protein
LDIAREERGSRREYGGLHSGAIGQVGRERLGLLWLIGDHDWPLGLVPRDTPARWLIAADGT